MKKTFCISLFFLAACASSSKDPNVYKSGEDRPLVDDKYSLQADRKSLDDLRAQIPPDRKRENDELALIMGLMAETKRPPAEIRSQFDSVLRKKRELFNKDLQKERETFTKEERKKREDFLKAQQQNRDLFNKQKHFRDEKNEFYKAADEKRSEFFSVERDKRQDFESDVRERRKSFEDYVREKQNEFNQEHRAYNKRYEELRKSNPPPHSSGNSEASSLERELMEIQSRPGTPLESGE